MGVPDTNTFTLEDVADEFGLGSGDALTDCFDDATAADFDPNYGPGDESNLLQFRNYDNGATGTRYAYFTGGPYGGVPGAWCNVSTGLTKKFYSTPTPNVGTRVFLASTGTSVLAAGNYGYRTPAGFNLPTNRTITVNSSGDIISTTVC